MYPFFRPRDVLERKKKREEGGGEGEERGEALLSVVLYHIASQAGGQEVKTKALFKQQEVSLYTCSFFSKL